MHPELARALAGIERLGARIAVLARRFCPADPEAATREVFAALWRDTTRDPDDVSALIVARRVLLARRAAHGVTVAAPGAPEPVTPRADPGGGQPDLFDREARLRWLLRALPARERAALELAVLRGWSYARIGDALEVSPEGAARHARRGLVALREGLHADETSAADGAAP